MLVGPVFVQTTPRQRMQIVLDTFLELLTGIYWAAAIYGHPFVTVTEPDTIWDCSVFREQRRAMYDKGCNFSASDNHKEQDGRESGIGTFMTSVSTAYADNGWILTEKDRQLRLTGK